MSTFFDFDSIWRDRDQYPNPCEYWLTAEQVAVWESASREVRANPEAVNSRPMGFVTSIQVENVVLPYPRIEIYAKNLITVDNIGGNILNTIANHNLAINDIVMTSASIFTSKGILHNVEYHVVAVPTPTSFQVSLTQGGPVSVLVDGTGLNMVMGVITPAEYVEVIGLLEQGKELTALPKIYLKIVSHTYNDANMIRSAKNVLDAAFALTHDKTQYDAYNRPVWLLYKSSGEQVIRFKLNDTMLIRFSSRANTVLPFFIENDKDMPTDQDKQTLITIKTTPYIRDGDFTHHLSNPTSI